MKKTSEAKLLAKIVDLESKLGLENRALEFEKSEKSKAWERVESVMQRAEKAEAGYRDTAAELEREKQRADDIHKMLIDRTAEFSNERARHRETFAALRIARRMIEAATERREP